MKKLIIVANWKSNKTIQETEKWLHDFSEGTKSKKFLENKKIIIAPSFTSLEHATYCSRKLRLPVDDFAAQDISPFGEGAYTGEVNAKQIKELADYIIVGHSERRRYFHEDEDVINQKIRLAIKYELAPILCVSSIKQIHDSLFMIHNANCIVAYEPLFAIGSGQPDTPKNADQTAKRIKEMLKDAPVLYGGSVTSKNVKSFTQIPNIDGVLVGGASLNPLEFFKIIENA